MIPIYVKKKSYIGIWLASPWRRGGDHPLPAPSSTHAVPSTVQEWTIHASVKLQKLDSFCDGWWVEKEYCSTLESLFNYTGSLHPPWVNLTLDRLLFVRLVCPDWSWQALVLGYCTVLPLGQHYLIIITNKSNKVNM